MSLEALNFSNGQTAQVPAAAPAPGPASIMGPVQGPGGNDIVQDLLKSINTPIDLKAATSLVPAQHQVQMPENLQKPIGPATQAPLIPQGVGAKHAKQVGIGNAILGVANALSSVVTAEAEHKQGQVRDGATKVITAQGNIDEAKQALESAKASGDTEGALRYQKIVDENQKVMSQVFSDPKLRKSLTKGFNLSYTDPTANKTEDHQAVQEAIKNAKSMREKREIIKAQQAKQNEAAGTAAAQAFTTAQPHSLGPNTQAQQHVNMQLQEKKVQQDALKDILNFRQSLARTGAVLEVGKQRIVEGERTRQMNYEHQQNMLNQRMAEQEKLLGKRFQNERSLMYERASLARKTAAAIHADKQADPLAIWTNTRKASEQYQRNFMADMKEYNALQVQRQNMYVDAKGKAIKPPEADVQALDAHIKLVHDQVLLDKQNSESFATQANTMQQGFGFTGGVSGADESNTSGSSDTNNEGSFDYSDPSAYENQSGSEQN